MTRIATPNQLQFTWKDGLVFIGPQKPETDGEVMKFITRCAITFEPNNLIFAELTVAMGGIDITACPVLSEETLRLSAERLGYHLIKKAAP